jgi:hypothetical protein
MRLAPRPSRGVRRVRASCVALTLALSLLGCQRRPPVGPAPPPPPQSVADLVASGRYHARLGQGLRAEQYFAAALAAGAPRQEALPPLIEVCLRGGRLQSALSHVEAALDASPGDAPLEALAASLRAALEEEP